MWPVVGRLDSLQTLGYYLIKATHKTHENCTFPIKMKRAQIGN